MQVLRLTVGPILGATTGQSARVWGRGVLEPTPNGPRRCFGVARVRPDTSSRFRPPVFFKMNPNFDMTGVARFDGLEPERVYQYQVGCFFSDVELPSLTPDFPLDWSGIPIIAFRTAATDPTRARSFVFGSCRYLLRLFGGAWFDARGDKTFRSVLSQVDAGVETDLVFMVGDQIYADDLNVIRPDRTVDEYNARYRDAFSQPYIRELMGRIPIYMILDDHEIEDNWPRGASMEDWVVKYPAAMHAYQTYQASHSPLLPMVAVNKMAGVPQKLWYTFSDGCCEFFVTDSRTERLLSDDPNIRRIMSDTQLQALKDWLADGSGRVKFVVTSVPFFPDPMPGADREDKWSGFTKQRGEILDLIRDKSIRRVVFLAGDYHFSLKSELISPGKPDFRLLSVVSSAFYWPYPHGSLRAYETEGPLAAMSKYVYEMVASSPSQSTDNFTRISADMKRLEVEVFGRKGELLSAAEFVF